MSEKYSLEAVQTWMKNCLMFPSQVTPENIQEHVYDSKNLMAHQRFGVYQRSYYLRLLKCMREQFPALCYSLGEQLFTDFAREYLQTYPSKSYTLYELGTRFPLYLEQTRPDKEESEENKELWIDFMIDLAHFELSLFLMFDAPGDEGKTFASPANFDNQLNLQSCFKLGIYGFDVAHYYHQVKQKKSPEFPQPQRLLIALVRHNYHTQTIPLKDTHYALLKSLEKGLTIKQALEMVAIRFNLDLATVISSWRDPNGIRDRWIRNGFFICN
jgi:hypothetical protein